MICTQCGGSLPEYPGVGRRRTKCDACRTVNRNAASKRWIAENKERHDAARARWENEHRDHVKSVRTAYRSKPEVKARRREWQNEFRQDRAHRLPLGTVDEMRRKQDDRCAICGRVDRLVVDHDHECCSGGRSCGKCVRGLICHSCNKMLGFAGDSRWTLVSAVEYLQVFEDGR